MRVFTVTRTAALIFRALIDHIAELYISVLSLPMSNDRPIVCFELQMRVLLRQPWKEID